ncbi:hypothetical protein BDI4_1390012 [Burkholderia diffusa]|nr:hypothetical protein BDI4_1390012 [Burkholderia diffusa]
MQCSHRNLSRQPRFSRFRLGSFPDVRRGPPLLPDGLRN